MTILFTGILTEDTGLLYIALLLLSAALTAGLALFGWRRRHALGVAWFAAFMGAGALWQLLDTVSLLSADPAVAELAYRAGTLPIAVIPVLFLSFALKYCGSRALTSRRIGLLLISPAITQVLVWTDSWHHLFFTELHFEVVDGLMVVTSWSPGPWFVVHSIYSFSLVLLGLGWLLVFSFKNYRVYRDQAVGFTLGSLAATLPILAYTLGLVPPHVVITPFCFLGMGVLFTWAILRHKLLRVVPVARDTLVDIMSDGMVVLDAEGRVLDLNPSARIALGLDETEEVVGLRAEEVLARLPGDARAQAEQGRSGRADLILPTPEGERYFDVQRTELHDRRGRRTGRLILLRDITDMERVLLDKERLLADLDQKNHELERLYGLALDANPMTGLPGNNSVSAAIRTSLEQRHEAWVVYTDLDHFKAYNDKYGFARGDEVIHLTARLLKEAAPADAFVGHVGGDDFVLVVPSDQVDQVTQRIIRDFDTSIRHLYDPEDLERGRISSTNRQGEQMDFPIMSISMAGVDLTNPRYSDYLEVADACAGLKHRAKSKSGSVFLGDQRRAEAG